jgi:ABC-type phosphate transport system substrate-binding protein
MKLWTLALAAALAAAAAGCDRRETTPPSPKTDSVSQTSPAAAGSSTTPANIGAPSAAEKREGANPVQGQVDPKHADQHRDFQNNNDGAGPRSPDTQPTMKN